MDLILLSHPESFEREIPLVVQLLELGVSSFHLRKPSFSKEELKQYIEKLPGEYYKNIVIHSAYELIDEFGLKGGHYKLKDNVPVSDKHCSFSFHSLDEIENYGEGFSYAFLGPVFDSISKKGYKAAFDHEALASFLQKNSYYKLIALGGIDETNAGKAGAMGFAGAAVMGSVWETFFATQSEEETINKFKRIKAACRSTVPTY